jgi:hypothetical protein
MPRCMVCGEITKPFNLYELEDGRVACAKCADEEDPMTKSKSGKKKIASLEVYEVDTGDGDKDYQIELSAAYGALDLTFGATVDEIRQFFTERRERKAQKDADVVPIASGK